MVAKKILVVDNNDLCLKFMDRELSNLGHEVRTASDALIALDILESYLPDVMFVDMVMPVIDGAKLCRIIRGMEKFSHTRLFIVSAIAAEEVIDMKGSGADAYIQKGPYQEMRQELLSALEFKGSGSETVGLPRPPNSKVLYPREVTRELLSIKRHSDIILNRMDEGIIEVNADDRMVYVNPAAGRIIGRPEERLLGQELATIFSERDRKLVRHVLMTRAPETFGQVPLSVNHFLVTLRIFPIDEETPSRLVLLKDITERTNAERALRESEKRYRHVVENVGIGMMVIQDECVQFVNSTVCRFLGAETEDFLSLTDPFEYLHPNDRRRAAEGYRQQTCGDKRTWMDTFRVLSADGHLRWLEATGVYSDWEGRPASIIFFSDVTEGKRVEKEKKSLEEQLHHAQKMESIGTLTSGVAHNFRNILAGVSIDSQLMRLLYPAEQRLQEIVDRIDVSLKRGARLIEDLMHFSHNTHQPNAESINLTDIIKETYRIISSSVDKRMTIRIDVPDFLPIKADQAKMSQVLMNLCTNARDAMESSGCLRIAAQAENGRVMVNVTDTGHGMTRAVQAKCFDPFFTTKELGKGTGLGLSTTYGIIKEIGGDIRLYSMPGKGTTFTISLPLARPDIFSSNTETREVRAGHGECILIVDDDPDILRPLGQFLERLQYDVHMVTGGQEALDRYSDILPDIVLLDRNMPIMDGLTCAGKLLEQDAFAKIILFSGYDQDGPNGLDDEAMACFQKYLTKPFDMVELSTVLAECLTGEPASCANLE
ncbi:Two-component system sensor histidine kinase [Olavius algarvensis associated proteobacterium Delta 3]|nr:Two-component system sensor histidine kinase [Olavius algarvensis associated proteobacterium Delta 3]